jgi:uncharacterized damage-inducible protein DinB
MKKILISLTALACLAASAFAEDSTPATLLAHLKKSQAFTVKVAEQMPEADYSFKLTPAQMSFAEQMAHIANANYFFYGTLAGEKQGDPKPASMSKADVIAFLNKSFEYSEGVLAKATPEQLNKMYSAEGGKMTGLELVMLAFDHTTHHRAQTEMYLRAKGITPTSYTF